MFTRLVLPWSQFSGTTICWFWQRAVCLTWKFPYECFKGISKCLTSSFVVVVFPIMCCVCFNCEFQDGILTELFQCGVTTLKRFGISYAVQQKCGFQVCCSHFIWFRTSRVTLMLKWLQLNQNDINFWMTLWAKTDSTSTFLIDLYFFPI